MDEILSKYGLYIDVLNKIRFLDPQASHQTNELKEECKVFVEKIDEFQKIVDSFISKTSKLGVEVEKQKIRAIGKINLMHSMTKHNETVQQQHEDLIIEKELELERLKTTLNSLQKTEKEQQDLINKLSHH